MKRIFFGLCVLIIMAWAVPSIAREAGSEMAPGAGSEMAPGAGSEMAPEAGSEMAPEAGSEMAPEAGSEMAPEAEFEITRLVMTSAIEDREPIDDKETFDVSIGKVYCFLEAMDVKNDTTVSFVWYYEDNVTASIELPIGKSSRWRTYSSKKLGGRKGLWRVEVQDASGAVLRDVTFTVQ